MSVTEKAAREEIEQTRMMTDDEATNMRLKQWWLREMELLQGMVDEGKLSGPPSIGMAARGLWNMAYKAGRLAALEEAAADAFVNKRDGWGGLMRVNVGNWLRRRAEALRSSSPEGSN